ncbi:MAG: Type 1 glutamine amidotransferase-like domain-containing protein [Clostridia bacterium]|nr:Type 1 glutamine amidotransferase-like domain-containing protein [Clostridia bacterium]
MKLILSSRDFGNFESAKFIVGNLPKPINECKILYFPNENATRSRIKSGRYENRLVKYGFSPENAFVADYFNPELFFEMSFDVVYVGGGNTFGILKRLRASKFDKLILKLVENGAVYVGGSAGAHIACNDVSHVARFDKIPNGFEDFSGLGFYDGIFVCHYSEERKAVFESLKAEGKNVIPLSDVDSILVEN